MFGTIGRARVKSGMEDQFRSVNEDWAREMRPRVPGHFIELVGKSVDRPDEILIIALAQDESTYRKLAEMPEQHDFFERFTALTDDGIRWEDIEVDVAVDD